MRLLEVKRAVYQRQCTFSLKEILKSTLKRLNNKENAELIKQIWNRLIEICGLEDKKRGKTYCYTKSMFSKIIGIDKKNFTREGKWRTLFEKNTCPPLHECAEIEYEGKLLEYVKKAWNGKIGRENGLYGLINNESDLRELFKNGHQTYVCYKEKQLKRF